MDRQARKLANRHNQGDRWVGCFTLLRCWGGFHETEATAELKSQVVSLDCKDLAALPLVAQCERKTPWGCYSVVEH